MKAPTTLIALILAAAIAVSSGHSVTTEPRRSGGDALDAATASVESVPSASREVPATLRPSFADYPLSIDVETVTVYATDLQQLEEAQHVLTLFAEAGVTLPPLEIWSHHDYSGCRLSGDSAVPNAGVYVKRHDAHTVYTCADVFTLAHELAHAHANAFLTDNQRAAFVSTRDADAWRTDEWARSGSEHFADAVAWGVTNGAVRPSRTLPNDDASLQAAFDLALSFTN